MACKWAGGVLWEFTRTIGVFAEYRHVDYFPHAKNCTRGLGPVQGGDCVAFDPIATARGLRADTVRRLARDIGCDDHDSCLQGPCKQDLGAELPPTHR